MLSSLNIETIIKAQSILFLARKLSFGKTDREESEELETVKISFKKAVEKVLTREITHAPSCILLLGAWVENQKQL